MKLAGGQELVIEARRQSPSSVYIESVAWNGKPHTKAWFAHADVVHGGRFVFHLSDKPEGDFGRSEAARPHSLISTSA
jgi:putative alpha-1,2-mannosidase